MSRCSRCAMEVGTAIHIFWGGEERRLEVEKTFGQPASLCRNPVTKVPKPVLCWCKGYVFDFDLRCVLCGRSYAEVTGEDPAGVK